MELKNINILLVIHEGGLGGAERQALGLAKYLTLINGCRVDVLLTHSNKQTLEFKKYVKESLVRNIIFVDKPYLIFKKEWSIKNVKRLKWSLQYLLKLRRHLIGYNYEIVIPFLNFPSKVSYFLYKLLPSVKTTFWHQLGLDSLSHDWLEYIAVKKTPFVIGNAANCFDMFDGPYKRRKNQLNLLPQYITLEKKELNKDTLRVKYKIPNSCRVIGMVAHFRPEKRQDLLLKAFLKSKRSNDFLILLGNKNNSSTTKNKYEELVSFVKINQLENQILVLSDIDVHEIFSIIDVGVLISDIEGMPNTVMEYMLYGLPIVATNHPGCKYLLPKSELLVDNNVETICQALNKLEDCESDLFKEEAKNNMLNILNFKIENYVNNLQVIINKFV